MILNNISSVFFNFVCLFLWKDKGTTCVLQIHVAL